MVALLDAIRTHLTEFEVPQLCSVHASIHEPSIGAQLRTPGAPAPGMPAGSRITAWVLAAELLAWADTLAEPTAGVWRTPGGHSVHVSVTGRLSGGVAVEVYDTVPFTARGLGGDLAPGAKAPVVLATLREVAALAADR